MASIAVISTSFCKSKDLRAYAQARLASHRLKYHEQPTALNGLALQEFLQDCEAAIVGREVFTREILQSLPKLKTLSVYGVGYDQIDTKACEEFGVRLLVKQGVNAPFVAEHTLGLMIAAMRNICLNNQLLHQGVWNKDGGRSLFGKTVAIVGAGAVGSAVARLLTSFKCNILLNDIVSRQLLVEELRRLNPRGRVEEVSLGEALEQANIVSLHVPLTAATREFINASSLAQMRSDATLINTARGGIINWLDLKKAINNGIIRTVASDVFSFEPLTDDELIGMDQVILTPHTAGNAVEAVKAMGQAAVNMLVEVLVDLPVAEQ